MAKIEPYFNVIINNADEVMLVIKNRQGEPSEPVIIFDGFNALLKRDDKNEILLTNMKESALRALQKVDAALVTETESGQLTFKKTKKGELKYREAIKQTYDVEVHHAPKLPELNIENPELLKKEGVGEKQTGIVKFRFFGWLFDRIVITICWLVMFTAIGIMLQQFSDKNNYEVTSKLQVGQEILQKHKIKWTPDFEFVIFWTPIYRTEGGVFVLESNIPELEAYQYSAIPEDKSKEYGFTVVYDFWDESGRLIIFGIFILFGFLGSFLPFAVFNIFGKAVESMK